MSNIKKIEEAIEAITNQINKIDDFWSTSSTKPRQGANPDEILKVEKAFGFSLPQDYREFLILHDGWELIGDLTFFSTAQQLDPPVERETEELQGGFWIAVSVVDDIGFYMRPNADSWEVFEVSQGMPEDDTFTFMNFLTNKVLERSML